MPESMLLSRDPACDTLTIVKVNVLGDLVPGTVVEVPDLLFVLYHACRLALLLVFQSNVVLNCFKVFSMLENKDHKKSAVVKKKVAFSMTVVVNMALTAVCYH